MFSYIKWEYISSIEGLKKSHHKLKEIKRPVSEECIQLIGFIQAFAIKHVTHHLVQNFIPLGRCFSSPSLGFCTVCTLFRQRHV